MYGIICTLIVLDGDFVRYNKKYIQKKLEDPLPPLQEDERIYLNVTYKTKSFAQYAHCGFDSKRKLWFTGSLNAHLHELVKLYGVNEATSEKARQLLKEKLDLDEEIIDTGR